MTACQMRLKTDADDRLGVLILCGKPDATLVRVSCTRMGHVENVIMCRRCMVAITYCQECFDQDKMLVRATRLILAR